MHFCSLFPVLPVRRQKWCSPEKARHFARGGFDGTNGFSDLVGSVTNDKEKKYRVSADYLLREIAGEYAIIPVGAACQISNAVMVPNDTAVFLWNTFQQPHTISEVVAQVAEEYEAPEEKIQDSVLNFVHDTLKYQLLEEVVSL